MVDVAAADAGELDSQEAVVVVDFRKGEVAQLDAVRGREHGPTTRVHARFFGLDSRVRGNDGWDGLSRLGVTLGLPGTR